MPLNNNLLNNQLLLLKLRHNPLPKLNRLSLRKRRSRLNLLKSRRRRPNQPRPNLRRNPSLLRLPRSKRKKRRLKLQKLSPQMPNLQKLRSLLRLLSQLKPLNLLKLQSLPKPQSQRRLLSERGNDY